MTAKPTACCTARAISNEETDHAMTNDQPSPPTPDPTTLPSDTAYSTGPDALLKLYVQWVALESDLTTERRRADQWQNLAGRYDDIRDWLRTCPDTPEGHAQFYREAAALIFPDAQDDDDA